mmetsp:Transcript_8437/g.10575  ORF Transcript_8437/g.10575 Transcript_8437/m.10575 type:complete len:87 (+) Transcript_8437:266-526(+)
MKKLQDNFVLSTPRQFGHLMNGKGIWRNLNEDKIERETDRNYHHLLNRTSARAALSKSLLKSVDKKMRVVQLLFGIQKYCALQTHF